ncbi:MAG: hypothetical protein AAFW82_07040, partial [Pseudomonadota bacterium]
AAPARSKLDVNGEATYRRQPQSTHIQLPEHRKHKVSKDKTTMRVLSCYHIKHLFVKHERSSKSGDFHASEGASSEGDFFDV